MGNLFDLASPQLASLDNPESGTKAIVRCRRSGDDGVALIPDYFGDCMRADDFEGRPQAMALAGAGDGRGIKRALGESTASYQYVQQE